MSYKGLFSCEDKVALVTGGAGLLGSEIAKALHDFGAKVYVGDVDEKKVKEISGDTGIKYVHLDITSEDSIGKAVETVGRDNGRLDIMVNSAYPRTKDWGAKCEGIKFDSWRQNTDTHLGGYFLSSCTAAEMMKTQKTGGSIINLASIYGVVAPDFSIYEGTPMTMPAAYASIKAGVIAMTKYIATYYGQYNVRANCVSPGGIFDNQHEAFVKRYNAKTPLCRMGRPDEIVGAAVFLASDASSYVTGENILVDGGWTAW